jgi:hypothetical protein
LRSSSRPCVDDLRAWSRRIVRAVPPHDAAPVRSGMCARDIDRGKPPVCLESARLARRAVASIAA